MHDHDDIEAAVCRIGDHRHHGTGRICTRHLEVKLAELAGVARMTRMLPALLVPGSTTATAGAKVTTSRTGSPTAPRLDVLSALGPGGAEVRRDARMLSPLVRRWSSLSSYTVTVEGPDGEPVVQQRQLRTWHAEVVTDGPHRPVECSCGRPHLDAEGRTVTVARPHLVLDDDQIGSIPPAEFLDMWVRRWRIPLQHTTSPIRGRVDLACDADQRRRLERARMAASMRAVAGSPALMPAVVQLAVMHREFREYLTTASGRVRMALLGIRDDGEQHRARVARALDPARLPDLAGGITLAQVHDPVAAEWAVRYGYAGVAAAVEVDARYLAQWLPLAAEHPDETAVDVARFAADLGALHRELQHLVGETRDDQWLGRCPAYLRDTDGEDTDRLCGAGLWQDPYRSRVDCPRCHTSWPAHEWMHLANLIRITWPIDRRRRYHQGDKVAAEKAVRDRADSPARAYRCRGCERVLTVDWVETTRRGERIRTWSPSRLLCPGGCIAGGTAVAA